MEQTPGWIALVNPGLIIVTGLFVYMGYRKGFLSKLLSCLSFIVIIFLSWKMAPALSKIFHILPVAWAPYQETQLAPFFYNYTNQLFIFAILVVVTLAIVIVLKPIVLVFSKLPVISAVDSLFGALFGFVEAFLWSLLLLFVLHTPLVENGTQIIEQTALRHVAGVQEKVFAFASDTLKEFDLMQGINPERDLEAMKAFLNEQGFSEEDIQQFLMEWSMR